MKRTQEEIENASKWINPKTKVRTVSKIEEDGTKTIAKVLDYGHKAVFHDEEGPALINKGQRKKEYYLNGIKYDYETWNEMMQHKEGLPWYKTAVGKGTSRH